MELSYYMSDVKGAKDPGGTPMTDLKIAQINTTIQNLLPADKRRDGWAPQGWPIENGRRNITNDECVDLALRSFTGDDSKGIEWFKQNGIAKRDEHIAACYDYNLVYNDYSGNRSRTPAPYTYLYNPYPGRRLPLYNWQDYAGGKNVKYCVDNLKIKDLNNNDLKLDAPLGWTAENVQVLWNEYEAEAQPKWVDNWILDADNTNTDYPLFAVNWKTTMRNLSVGALDTNVILQEMVDKFDPGGANIHLHPDTAAKHGIKNGDRIEVISQHVENGYPDARVEGTVYVTNMIHTTAVGFPGNYGWFSGYLNPAITNRGANYNQLLHNQPPFVVPNNGATSNVARVKIRKI
jgi:anaerobic selenocysteine-containing dehydrogenase